MKFFSYLKLPFSAIRLWFEANETRYSRSEKWKIFKVLLSLRFREIAGSRNKVISQTIFGFRVYAYDYPTLLFLFREIFLTRDYYFETDKLNPRVIDCGANIGMAVLYIKYIHPGARITAFEPNPTAFELLKLNVESNRLQGVELINKAVSNSHNPIRFYVNEDMGTLLASVRNDRGGNKELTIETDLLSNFITEETDLVKIDVEGAEWLILENLKNYTEQVKNIHRIIMEYHHKISGEKSRLTSFLTFFEEQGFEYNIRTEFYNKGDFQDLILNFYR